MTGQLGDAGRARIARAGVAALGAAEGLALLDAALGRDEGLLVPARLDVAGLRAMAARGGADDIPALLRGLVPAWRAAKDTRTDAGTATAGTALRERLALADEEGQERLLTDLVRGEVAVVLGHESPDAVDMESGLLELGFDSLTIVEFRNRVNAATGLRLPGSTVLNCPTPAELVRRVHAELIASSPPETTSNALEPQSLRGLYKQAVRSGRTAEIMTLIAGLAAFRPAFTSPSGLENIPQPVPVCRGTATPGIICFSSFASTAGAQEYARFARSFRGSREVSVIPVPGFAEGEPLAATVDALIGVQAENVRRSVSAPFVLAGHSSGGLIAHAVATRLENIGLAPAAIVLIDTYSPDRKEMAGDSLAMLPAMILANDEQQGDPDGDSWLTAMAHYFSLGWGDLAETTIPTLLVRATEPMAGTQGDDEWRLSWAYSSGVSVMDVPGSHFTMMAEHADTTAKAVSEWLSCLQDTDRSTTVRSE
jgi:thioesterase domain-containing protein/acyl carrier protein